MTDALDRRLMNCYMDSFFCEDALSAPGFRLSRAQLRRPNTCPSLPRGLRASRHRLPEAWALPNADIASAITSGNAMLETVVSLQPRTADASGVSPDDLAYGLAEDLLGLVPEPVSVADKAGDSDGSALYVVLVQELQRYNALLGAIRSSLTQVQKGIRGLVVMSPELDVVFKKLLAGQVPPAWLNAYPSLKPLASWSRDLVQRWAQLMEWCEKGPPKVYWLAGFTYPNGFLTALMQTSARANNVSIDTLMWDFPVSNVEEKDITSRPKEGAYVKGLFLEGAGWSYDNSCLCEPEPMELIYSMPIIHFKPVEAKKSKAKGMYACPLYLYPLRTGSRERPSWMLNIEIKSGAAEPDVWVKRGTALLLALAE